MPTCRATSFSLDELASQFEFRQRRCGIVSPFTHASSGFQWCVCLQEGHSSGTRTGGNDSKTMVAVSKPVETDSPVTGQWIKISATKITLLGYADPALTASCS